MRFSTRLFIAFECSTYKIKAYSIPAHPGQSDPPTHFEGVGTAEELVADVLDEFEAVVAQAVVFVKGGVAVVDRHLQTLDNLDGMSEQAVAKAGNPVLQVGLATL